MVGLLIFNGGHVVLYNCLLINNIAQWNNHADNSWLGDGGAVYAQNSQMTLGNCSLINNSASLCGRSCVC